MIVVDASAPAAICFMERDAPKFLQALQQTPKFMDVGSQLPRNRNHHRQS
jgi:hypothetical protein